MNYSVIINTIKAAIQQGEFGRAFNQFETVELGLTSHSERQELLYLATVTCRQQNALERAKGYAQQLTQINSKHARAHQELGYIYLVQKADMQAAKAFYEATRRNPALLSAWRSLTSLYLKLGNQQAHDIAQQQVSYLSGLPREILGARDLLNEGQIQLADKICRNFLREHKHHVEGMLLLAEVGIQSKVYSEAEFLLESSHKLHPDHLATGIEYLKLLSKTGKFNAAKSCAVQLLNGNPNNPVVLTAQATAMVGLGELDEAVELYRSLLNDDSQRPSLWLLLGHALKARGDLAGAIAAYQSAHKLQPDFGDAYWSLANTKTYRFTEKELSNMLTLAKHANVSEDNKIHILFALGKAYEDAKEFQKSFQHYALGNQTKQNQLQYQAQFVDRQVMAQMKYFSKALVDKYKIENTGHPSSEPIFIVGLPRAGSTLLEQILASHSQVDGTMELHNILGLVARLRGKSTEYPAILSEVAPGYLHRFGEQYINETRVYRNNAPFFIDKMPNNFLHIGLIKLILPNAKIIDARRDPMACCFSGFKQLFGEGQEFSYSQENIGYYYMAYTKLMAHWDKVLPGSVLRVQHEDVIEDLAAQVKRILAFCGLPFEQQCIDFHLTQRVIKTPSSEQVRQPIYRSGMQQWKHYESFLQPLKSVLASQL